MKKILNKGLKSMFSVIESNQIMTGLFQNTKIVEKNIKKWQKMIEKRKNKNNFGVNYFQFRIKTVLKMKRHLSKCFRKFILLKGKKSRFLL